MVPGVTTAEVIHAGITSRGKPQDLMLLAEAPIHLEPLEAVDFLRGPGCIPTSRLMPRLYYP